MRKGWNLFLGHSKLAGKRFVCWETISGCRMNLLPSFSWQRGLRTALIPGWHGIQTPFPSWPSMGHWGEPKRVPHPKRALSLVREGLGHLLNRRGTNLRLPDWIPASNPVSHWTEQVPAFPPPWAALQTLVLLPQIQKPKNEIFYVGWSDKWNILLDKKEFTFWLSSQKVMHVYRALLKYAN